MGKNDFQDYREIKGTVASLRLDSLVGLGYGLSRSKAAENVKAGLVQVNEATVFDPAARIKEEDVIELSKRGSLELKNVMGKSRKGRQNIILKKYYNKGEG